MGTRATETRKQQIILDACGAIDDASAPWVTLDSMLACVTRANRARKGDPYMAASMKPEQLGMILSDAGIHGDRMSVNNKKVRVYFVEELKKHVAEIAKGG